MEEGVIWIRRRSTIRREDVALVIADQWMPEMSGREMLGRVRALEPLAKRALLVLRAAR